jgi:hypothetical protein
MDKIGSQHPGDSVKSQNLEQVFGGASATADVILPLALLISPREYAK